MPERNTQYGHSGTKLIMLNRWSTLDQTPVSGYFVKLFDTFDGLNAIEQSPDAEEPTITDNGNNVQRVLDT